jgi:prepilin-type processing-associated H-X9-DG protein
LKQFGLAIEQYKQDYDSMYPFSRNQLGGKWYDYYLDPYVKSKQLNYCPSHSDWISGYGYNIAFGYFPGVNITPSRSGLVGTYCGLGIKMYDGVNEAVVTNPSETVLLLDSTLSYYYLTKPPVSYSDATAKGSIEAFFPQTTSATMVSYYNHPEAAIHNDGLNAVYADGHAKWRKLNFYLDPTVWCPAK